MLYGYIRTFDSQSNDVGAFLRSCPVTEDALFVDSGKNSDLTELARLLSSVEEGDEVHVWDITQFGATAREYLDTLKTLTDRGVGVHIHSIRLRFGPHRDSEKTRKSFYNIVQSLKRLENNLSI